MGHLKSSVNRGERVKKLSKMYVYKKPPMKSVCSVRDWPIVITGQPMTSPSYSPPDHDMTEKFWVPPEVIERKRAQSLVSSLSHHESDDQGKCIFVILNPNNTVFVRLCELVKTDSKSLVMSLSS